MGVGDIYYYLAKSDKMGLFEREAVALSLTCLFSKKIQIIAR